MALQRRAATVVLGVTGGIACYKAVELLRLMLKEGLAVQVVMTRGATEFVTPLTFQTLSERPVLTETFDLTQESRIGHINVADTADLFVIAPATANIIGKIAGGMADDLLSTILMATRAPVLLAPAMNIHMYEHPILQENLGKLRRIGYHVLEPDEGYLACGYEGRGRLPDPEKILEAALGLLSKKDLPDERILVTAGATREPLDPVRYLSNRSSGKMGYAVARAAARRGAEVVLVSGPTALAPPPGARVLNVTTTAEMRAAVLSEFATCTTAIMAAAVADYHPVRTAGQKIKKGAMPLQLSMAPNPDILQELGAQKERKFLIGFAAETEDLLGNARLKLAAKNLDMIVANDVTQPGSGFDADTNIAAILDRRGGERMLPLMTKDELAAEILNYMLAVKSTRCDGDT